MDRRRRALGLKKKNNGLEDKTTNSNSSPVRRNVAVNIETSVKVDKKCRSRQTGTITTKQDSPKCQSSVTPLKTNSPGSPLHSPGLRSMFPRTLGSPEIEVSWDWGCSQVTKEMLRPRRVKHESLSQPPAIVDPVVTSCHRLLPCRQISEEENQERLAFYKNVLSKSLKCVSKEVSVDSENNNLESEVSPYVTTINITPNHSKLRMGSEEDDKQINEFFDDSANEFMLECSQAIEEKLKNGEIDMGPIVSIIIPNLKHAHSPVEESENAHKKVCHGRTKLNLFPEANNKLESSASKCVNEKECLKLRSPRHKQLKTGQHLTNNLVLNSNKKTDFESENDILLMRPTQVNENLVPKKTVANGETSLDSNKLISGENSEKPTYTNNFTKLQINVNNTCSVPSKPICNPINTHATLDCSSLYAKRCHHINNNPVNGGNNNKSAQNISTRIKKNVNNANYDSVDKFRRVQNGNSVCNLPKPQVMHNPVINKSTVVLNPVLKPNTTVNNVNNIESGQTVLETNVQDTKPSVADFTSLLDDGFDVELSRLDFDSLCGNSHPKEPEVQPPMKNAPKMCSQQEIEAKRIAALNRLMMKKRR